MLGSEREHGMLNAQRATGFQSPPLGLLKIRELVLMRRPWQKTAVAWTGVAQRRSLLVNLQFGTVLVRGTSTGILYIIA